MLNPQGNTPTPPPSGPSSGGEGLLHHPAAQENSRDDSSNNNSNTNDTSSVWVELGDRLRTLTDREIDKREAENNRKTILVKNIS